MSTLTKVNNVIIYFVHKKKNIHQRLLVYTQFTYEYNNNK